MPETAEHQNDSSKRRVTRKNVTRRLLSKAGFCQAVGWAFRAALSCIPCWDTILHTFSGAMLGVLGFSLLDIMNNSQKVKVKLSPAFTLLFAFCFALAIGGLWEIYEYSLDGLLGLNMQKFMLEDGTMLVGRAALQDTMADMIVDAVGAFTMCVLGYLNIKRKERKHKSDSPAA